MQQHPRPGSSGPFLIGGVSMKLDKILRVLVCLALVCCIILNVAAVSGDTADFIISSSG